ncbi:hypothetical protein PHSY_004815 [Pseudozyma hubeiensis SY62]|uniref:Uncharacterized protein n=1 Tax=Pseudozyma hubeiensis (strain SY62) TaxID=1305764 RepID=R9PGK1_PSEHS|nr:hypothetical protein PHSY_004815 [Pseudozyma hubeiensis SY62]GAC97230.1 hypothetical protein PHSY_004815 [Pseudozyma hubeiensis SY62]
MVEHRRSLPFRATKIIEAYGMLISAVGTVPDNVTAKFRWTRHRRLFTIPPVERRSMSPKPMTSKGDLTSYVLCLGAFCRSAATVDSSIVWSECDSCFMHCSHSYRRLINQSAEITKVVYRTCAASASGSRAVYLRRQEILRQVFFLTVAPSTSLCITAGAAPPISISEPTKKHTHVIKGVSPSFLRCCAARKLLSVQVPYAEQRSLRRLGSFAVEE